MKKNGFRRPFHKLQLFSWIYTFFATGTFSFLALPLFNYPSRILLIIIFSILFILVIILAFLSTYIDPTDPAIKESIRAELLSKAIDYKKYPKICKVCKHHVNLDTKHCRECERCVLHFDHHCKWLNNCIGVKNYRQYYLLLIFFCIYNLFIFTFSSIALYGLSHKTSLNHLLIDLSKISYSQQSAYSSILIMLNIFAGLIIIAMTQLISFHTYLAYKQKTTYEFILERRKAKNKYKVTTIKVINENEAIEEVPLEEVFEPYMENPQFQPKEPKEQLAAGSVRIFPEHFIVPPISESEESVHQPHSA